MILHLFVGQTKIDLTLAGNPKGVVISSDFLHSLDWKEGLAEKKFVCVCVCVCAFVCRGQKNIEIQLPEKRISRAFSMPGTRIRVPSRQKSRLELRFSLITWWPMKIGFLRKWSLRVFQSPASWIWVHSAAKRFVVSVTNEKWVDCCQ